MSRKDFTRIDNIPVADILLDESNVRFDVPPGSQLNCQKKLLDKTNGKKLVTLAEHIAKHGIGLSPIVLSKDESDRYIVRDGNRRIAALTFLNNPSGCPVKSFCKTFSELREQHEQKGNITPQIGCWLGNSEEAILEHISLQHSGQMDGAGQIPLETRARDRLETRITGKNSRHGQVNRWLLARKDDIPGIDNFDLTNIQRLVNSKKNLTKLGFNIDKDGIIHPSRDEEEIAIIWQCILRRVEKVSDIYYATERDAKIDEAVAEAKGIITARNLDKKYNQKASTETTSPTAKGKKTSPKGQDNASTSQDSSDTKEPSSANTGTKPRKPSAQRDYLIVERMHQIKIPNGHLKARDIVWELRKLNVNKHRLAVATLFRALFELSLVTFLETKGRHPGNNYTTNQLINNTIEECNKDTNFTNKKGRAGVFLNRLIRAESSYSIIALHKCVHDDSFSLDGRDLCAFYDEYDYFFMYWWEQVATAG